MAVGLSPIDFGIRRVPPCGDCWPDGHCSMNCGPAIQIIVPKPAEEKRHVVPTRSSRRDRNRAGGTVAHDRDD